jgi:hypothetical protein
LLMPNPERGSASKVKRLETEEGVSNDLGRFWLAPGEPAFAYPCPDE